MLLQEMAQPSVAHNAALLEDWLTEGCDGSGLSATFLMRVFFGLETRFPIWGEPGLKSPADEVLDWSLLEGRRKYPVLDLHIHKAALGYLERTKLVTQYGAPISELAFRLWRSRADLREQFPRSDAGLDPYFAWYVMHGLREYDLYSLLSEQELVYLCEPDPGLEQDLDVPVTRLQTLVRRARPDVQNAFDLDRREGRQALLEWSLTVGQRQYGFFRDPRLLGEPAVAWLNDTAPGFERSGLRVSRLAVAVRAARPDLLEKFDLSNRDGVIEYVTWFYQFGVREEGLVRLLDRAELSSLVEPTHIASDGATVPRILTYVAAARADLIEMLERTSDSDPAIALRDWYDASGAREYDGLVEFYTVAAARAAGGQGAQAAGVVRPDRDDTPVAVIVMQSADADYSANHIRAVETAWRSAGVSPRRIDLGWLRANEITLREAVRALAGTCPVRYLHWCLPVVASIAERTWSEPLTEMGIGTVATWDWELDTFPEEIVPLIGGCDHVVAATRTARAAFLDAGVAAFTLIHPAVDLAGLPQGLKSAFGLPDRDLLFAASCDIRRGLDQDYPLGQIAAFMTAFPRGDEACRLWLELRVDRRAAGLAAIVEATAERDPRIRVNFADTGGTPNRAIIAAADVYVSLRRASVFDSDAARALLLGKAVVAPDHSGYDHLVRPDTAMVVSGGVTPILPGQHPFAAGRLWADPDLDHAAWLLRRVADRERLRDRLALAGRAHARRELATAVVSRRYAAFLRTMMKAQRHEEQLVTLE